MTHPPDRTPPAHEPHWLKTLWTLRQLNVDLADCELWHHPLGRELRLTVNQDLLRSRVFKGEDLGWVEASQEWQRAFEAKGGKAAVLGASWTGLNSALASVLARIDPLLLAGNDPVGKHDVRSRSRSASAGAWGVAERRYRGLNGCRRTG